MDLWDWNKKRQNKNQIKKMRAKLELIKKGPLTEREFKLQQLLTELGYYTQGRMDYDNLLSNFSDEIQKVREETSKESIRMAKKKKQKKAEYKAVYQELENEIKDVLLKSGSAIFGQDYDIKLRTDFAIKAITKCDALIQENKFKILTENDEVKKAIHDLELVEIRAKKLLEKADRDMRGKRTTQFDNALKNSIVSVINWYQIEPKRDH